MTIQKKSLISSLNTTKKAIVASSPLAAPTSSETSVRLGRVNSMARLGKVNSMAKLGKVNSMAKLGKVNSMAKLGKI